jgi:signal transduction histidine kinase
MRSRIPTEAPLTRAPGLGSRILLPLAIAVVQIGVTAIAGKHQLEREDLDLVGVLLLAAGPAALMVRHRYPVAVLGVAMASTLGYLLLDYPRGPIFFALIVAFVTAVMSGHRIAAVVSLLIGYPAFLWLPDDIEPGPDWTEALGLAAWLLVLLAGAEIARSRRQRAAELARVQAEETLRRASEERLRIARELHDVLAHNISLISVQAGVALHLMDERPEQARDALTAIKQASNQALGELRSVLDILRDGYEAPPLTPIPSLAHLDDLVAKTEAVGLPVIKSIKGSPRSLSPRVELAAYRIVQEALTNVTRHAGQARATITIAYGERDLTVQIEDDGRGPRSSETSGGKGLTGMRERVMALDGELQFGPRPEGGFRVRARLPVSEDRTKS